MYNVTRHQEHAAIDTVAAEDATEFADDPFAAWFAPTIERSVLQGLMRRSDAHALRAFSVWLACCLATGYLVVMARHSLWLWPAMAVYGTILTFAYAASHECAHGTAFKTRWLNETVFWITSLVFIEEPLYRRYSHAGHHTNTWFNALDPQKPYGNPVTPGRYLIVTLGLTFYADALSQLLRHSAQSFTAAERDFLPPSQMHRVAVNSRIMLICYAALAAYGVCFYSAWPFLLYFIPRYFGGIVVGLYINSQHMCMAEDLHDHRLTTRSIRCNWLERLLYWNMNYHVEHHLFPAVPFHAMPALNAHIADQLPAPTSSVMAANADILRAILRQRTEPKFNLAERPARVELSYHGPLAPR